MIPREDFGTEGESFILDLFQGFPISYLAKDAPVLKLLRKPDFQRETNHWMPEQIATFITSFLDNEIIPGLILWKSASYVFVIDGGHRLSALRAWLEDDYGDRGLSNEFYGGALSQHQKNIAKRTRRLVESSVGRFADLRDSVGAKTATDMQKRRASLLFTRAIPVQWIQGSASVAETSFFKINSQGTPLDETESMLIVNRNRPIAICARAILRAGTGHKYWRRFDEDHAAKLEEMAAKFYNTLFEPEVREPLRTLDIPIGGTVSPVDALSLLIDFLTITGSRAVKTPTISEYPDDDKGGPTIKVMENATAVVNRITGNSRESLGLHPAVYFYNDRGKYSRFMFLAVGLLFAERLKHNDGDFFHRFIKARQHVEQFLMDNRSLIGITLQNMGKAQRVPKLRDLLTHLVKEGNTGRAVSVQDAIELLGLHGRIIDVVAKQTSPEFSDSTKSMIFIRKALDAALTCPICHGILDPNKAVSYDHKTPKRDGGLGNAENGDLVHPFCNTGVKS